MMLMLAGSGLRDTPRSALAQASTWQPLNAGLPARIAITAMAFDPQNARRLYVGTASAAGVWFSEDGASSGHFAGGPLAGRVAYVFLADPQHPNELLAGTDAGLYQSSDAGRTWQQVAGLPDAAVYGLARDAAGAVLAGGAGPILYRRAPGGNGGWQALTPPPGNTAILSLAVSPRGSLVMAGTAGAGLFLSRDEGRTWENMPALAHAFVAGLAFDGTDGRTVLARSELGLYATGDGGTSWRQVARNVSGHIDALAVVGQGDVYLGTSDGTLYRRRAGSETWQLWGTGIGRPGTFSSLLATPGTSSRWYAGAATGLYVSDDAGLTWRAAQPGPGHASATALAVAGDGALYLGNEDGVFRSTNGGQGWQPLSAGLPTDTVLALAFADSDRTLMYAGLAGQGLYRSRDGGLHWEATTWTKRGVPAVLVDRRDARHVFIRVAYERVYESTDGGQTWAARWNGLDLSTQIISLAMDPQRSSVLYAGGTEGFFRSLNGADVWQSVGPELAGQTVFGVSVAPQNGQGLYAGATNGAYESRDGGEHWTRWGRGLENITVTGFAFALQDPRLVFAGTKYQGVFQSRDGGQNWQYVGPDRISVNNLVLAPDGQWLYAATASGVYRMAAPR